MSVAEVLVVDGLQGQSFGPVSFTLESGEIVGIAGAEGNGQPQLFDCLAGRQPPKAGRVVCDGKELSLISTHEAVAAGVMLLPGDRKHEALMPVLGVKVNATIQSLRRFSVLGLPEQTERAARRRTTSSNGWRSGRRRSSNRSSSSPGATSRRSRWPARFLKEPSVILAYEPTQGVDVGSRFDIYKALRTRTDAGTAMLVKSSDPIELAGLCDRVLVMSRGQIIEEIPGDELDELRIVEAIVRGPGLSKAGRSPARRRDAEGALAERGAMSERVDAARRAVRKVLRDARDKNKWRKIVRFRLWMPVVLQILLVAALLWYTNARFPGFVNATNVSTDPHPGAPPDRRRDGSDACAPRRVSRSLRRWHDRPRGGRRLVPDRRRGLASPRS